MDAWTAAFLVSLTVPPALAVSTYPLLERRYAEPWRTIAWTRDTAYRSARAEMVHAKLPRIVRIAAVGCWVAGSLAVPWVLCGGWSVFRLVSAVSSTASDVRYARVAWLARNIATAMYAIPLLTVAIFCVALCALHARAAVTLVSCNLARTSGLRVVAAVTIGLNALLLLLLVVWSVLSPSPRTSGTLGNVLIAFALPGIFTMHALALRRGAAMATASGQAGTPRAPAA